MSTRTNGGLPSDPQVLLLAELRGFISLLATRYGMREEDVRALIRRALEARHPQEREQAGEEWLRL